MLAPEWLRSSEFWRKTASSYATTASWILHMGFTASKWISGPGYSTHVRCDTENPVVRPSPLRYPTTYSLTFFRQYRRGGHCGLQLLTSTASPEDDRSTNPSIHPDESIDLARNLPEAHPPSAPLGVLQTIRAAQMGPVDLCEGGSASLIGSNRVCGAGGEDGKDPGTVLCCVGVGGCSQMHGWWASSGGAGDVVPVRLGERSLLLGGEGGR